MRNVRSFTSNTLRSKRDNLLPIFKSFHPAFQTRRSTTQAVACETPNFLELEIERVTEILHSSDLNVTSEPEVFNAANAWSLHRKKERARHAKTLLLKVRLRLLSRRALERLLRSSTFCCEAGECLAMLKRAADGGTTKKVYG